MKTQVIKHCYFLFFKFFINVNIVSVFINIFLYYSILILRFYKCGVSKKIFYFKNTYITER